MDGLTLEWAQVIPQMVVVATSESAWTHRPPLGLSDAFSTPMQCRGSIASTRNLLEGSLAAAQQTAFQTRATSPRISPLSLTIDRWVWRLAGYYNTTHATPALMAEAAERFAAEGRTELAEYATLKSFDEAGHDQLALEDLRALGYEAERVVEDLVPPTARGLVNYFTELVRAPDPVGCVGYAYALERMAITVRSDHIAAVEAILPPGVNATRCLRVHSALGDDAFHVEDEVEVTSRLPPADRIKIVQACYQTVLRRNAAPQGEYLSEEALAKKLAVFKRNRQ
ncbi:MAG TPA: hypothetical protein VGC66_23310 [Pyrinomonadaceae bacterium]